MMPSPASSRGDPQERTLEESARGFVLDPSQIIVANNPLPQSGYPANAPHVEDTHLKMVSQPAMLNSVDELAQIMTESRESLGFSNFSEVSTPKNSARAPVYPTFTRFSSTRFANAERAEYKVIDNELPDSDALYDMCYPISLIITDGRNLPLPGIPAEGIVDSKGYPLFYSSDTPKRIIKARSSGALYPANVSRSLGSRMATFPDPNTVRTWAHMFQLNSEKDAQAILLQRVLGSGAGDNHIALLFKGYMAYLDSIAGALEGVVPSRNRLSPTGVVINTTLLNGWTTQILGSSAEIVNVLGGSPDYQEFWAYCCFDQAPIFAAKSSGGVLAATMFSNYQMGPGVTMACICDCDAYSTQRHPTFFGRPNLILGFIETYVQKFGLQQQANEALQIAMLWPTLCQTHAHISLPRPLHAVDWFGGEVEHTSIETPYRGLISSSPFVVLASTLASAWALQSQIYDYITLLTSKRATWKLSPEAIKSSIAWLMTHASAPGVGWDFLLRHQFHITPSFLYLTGLSVEVVDWRTLLSGFLWREDQFPAHLRLMQPYWVRSSVCCLLPWEKTWTPKFETSAYLLTASPATIMCMLRLGLLRGINANQTGEQDRGVFPILDRAGDETVEYNRLLVEQLRVVYEHGVRVLALSTRPRGSHPAKALRSVDPADSRAVRDLWSVANFLQQSDNL
jgi:hypothetical protein